MGGAVPTPPPGGPEGRGTPSCETCVVSFSETASGSLWGLHRCSLVTAPRLQETRKGQPSLGRKVAFCRRPQIKGGGRPQGKEGGMFVTLCPFKTAKITSGGPHFTATDQFLCVWLGLSPGKERLTWDSLMCPNGGTEPADGAGCSITLDLISASRSSPVERAGLIVRMRETIMTPRAFLGATCCLHGSGSQSSLQNASHPQPHTHPVS